MPMICLVQIGFLENPSGLAYAHDLSRTCPWAVYHMPMICLAQITVLEKSSVPHRCYKTSYQCTTQAWHFIFYITFIIMTVLKSLRPIQKRDDNAIIVPPLPQPLCCHVPRPWRHYPVINDCSASRLQCRAWTHHRAAAPLVCLFWTYPSLH